MSKFLKVAASAAVLLATPAAALAQDAAAGEKVFARCKACHMVGENAKNRVGPELNDLFGRTAGTVEGFRYSKAMTEAGAGGLVWTEETVAEFVADPRGFVKGTRMVFAGLKKEEDVANLLAYLKTFSEKAAEAPHENEGGSEPKQDAAAADTEASDEKKAKVEPAEEPKAPAAEESKAPAEQAPVEQAAAAQPVPTHGVLHLGRPATEEEIAAWNIDVRPDGQGLPEGSGTVMEGEPLYAERCASCHGDFGEAIGRWPVLADGIDTLTRERPVKTVGSYWPYLSTVYDYIRRAMPFGDARSLSNDEVYALTAYVLYLNDIVTDEDFELSKENFTSIKLPNEDGFIDDNRHEEPYYAQHAEPCMKDCKPGKAEITMHAAVLDVTPDTGDDGEEPSGGSID